MFTTTEKKYLALALVFLAVGSGIKAYRRAHVRIGPMEDARFAAADSSSALEAIGKPGDSAYHDDSAAAAGKDSVRDSSSGLARTSGHTASSAHAVPARKADFSGKVSLNRAAPAELTAIRGVGGKTAQAIVQYRKEHGPFHDLRELLQVKGIGEKKLEKIIPFLIL